MPTDLSTFFFPKSVAVIGASRSPEKLGYIILKSILESGFSGKVYPVNPHAEKIQDLEVFPNIESLPEVPELAVVSVPAALVNEIMEKLGAKGVVNVVVLSAGFKEIGSEGLELEKKLVEVASKHKINLLGPNCLGFINNLAPINATFAEGVKETGNLRFLSQSGAIAAAMFDFCNTTGLGISEFITLGNKAGITENDVLYHFHHQEQNSLTNHLPEGLSNMKPIGLYLESISNGKEFLRLVEEISKKDPVLIIKPGKTQAAAKAMQSHTGSIAGEDVVLDEVLRESGAIRCDTLEEFFDYSRAFAWENLPNGPKMAVISNAGGPAVITADAVVEAGLELAQFDDETKKKLEEALPRSASIVNPVDVLGDALADRFAEAIEAVLSNSEVDSLLVLLTPQLMTQTEKTAETIGELSKKYNKTVFCSFIGGHAVARGRELLNKYKIPTFSFPERAVSALSKMWKFKQRQMIPALNETSERVEVNPEMGVIRNQIQYAVNEKQKTLDNLSVDKILAACGINTPPTKKAENYEEALEFANEFGWPVVLKLSSPGLLHKKDVGGVEINILTEKQLDDAWHKLERKIEQLDAEIKEHVTFQVQKEVLGGVEVIVGVRNDPTFGKILLFGAGGAYSEVIEDRNIHLLPIDLAQAKKLIRRSRIYKLLEGADGDVPHAVDKLADLIVRLGKISIMIPEASDIEINPVIVTINDVWSVDGKVVLNEQPKKQVKPPKLIEATCTKHEVLAKYFNYYEIETPEPFEFEPGQYVSVKVAPNAIRAYSIATRVNPNKFGLLVDIRPGGPGSKFFENLKAGDKVPFLGPFGVFTLKKDEPSSQLLFLGTGSGMSALRCMIDRALLEWGETRPMTLYFGLTNDDEIFWKDHFDELQEKFPNFKYEIVLYEPSDDWNGPKGYNTQLVTENFEDACNVSAYLCGHRAMIAGATEILQGLNCPENQIYSERFV